MKKKTKYKLTTFGISQLKMFKTSKVALESGRSIPAIYDALKGKLISLDTLNRFKGFFDIYKINFFENICYETIEPENSDVEKETI